VPILSSYLPPPEARGASGTLGWVLAPVSIRRWLNRESSVGWRSALLLFGAAFGGAFVPVAIYDAMRVFAKRTVFTSDHVAMLLFSLLLFAISICAYSLWGVVATAACKDRRLGALTAVLVILALNVTGTYYAYNSDAFRRLQFLGHPLVALVSPVPAGISALWRTNTYSYWAESWSDPRYLIGAAFLYQVVILVGAMLSLRRRASG
jgi:hypothetical protein